MKNTFWIFTLAALVAGLALAGCAKASGVAADAKPASASDAKPASEVKIDNFSFTPATITVPVGATVRWTNRDDIPHTVAENDKLFKSKTLDTDEQFTYTFTKAGTYSYFCSLHPKMTGKVTVQ